MKLLAGAYRVDRLWSLPRRMGFWYVAEMTREQIDEVLESVRSWPAEDQNELAEIARDIEARRTGKYRANAEELKAIDEAVSSGTATEEEITAAFRTFRLV